MTDDNHDNHDNFDDILDGMAEGMAEYLTMRLQMLRAETQLEALIAQDFAEVLTDENGNFTYRLTKKGINAFVESRGFMPDEEALRDVTFSEFAGLSR